MPANRLSATSDDMFKGVDPSALDRIHTGRTFAAQAHVPRLPVPQLEDTLATYLRSTGPLHRSPEAAEETRAAVHSALDGLDAPLVRQLQSRLETRAKTELNWLADWWNEIAYFGYRDAVMPHVNYFYCHTNVRSRSTNLLRAPALAKAWLAFHRLVSQGELEPDMSKYGPLDMSQALWLFNSCRIPRAGLDYAVKADPATHNHLVVLRNGKFWVLDILHPVSRKELSESELRFQLQRILNDPQSREPETYPIGALTGVNRDTWAQARNDIIASPSNRRALKAIESSVFVLALDNEAPVTPQEKAWALWTGGRGALNRFFDKQQLVVCDNGVSGYNGEHSTMDGGPTARLNDFALSALVNNKVDMGTGTDYASLPPPQRLEFDLSSKSKAAVLAAQTDFDAAMAQCDVAVQNFVGYGKDQIKALGVSPDAWVQMMIQLAYHKLHREPTAVYEAAQTRKFLLGRTEVVRSCSNESTAFCRAFLEHTLPDKQLYGLLLSAVEQHLRYARSAADGCGVDRHLLGLKKSLKPGEPIPRLFTDPAFTESSYWRLSTSQISSEYIAFLGFGPVVPGGYGVAYSIKRKQIDLVISAPKTPGTDAHRLAHYLQESALELQNLVTRVQENKAHA